MVDFTKQKEIAEVLAKMKKLRENYTTINHVYQESYIENHHVTGFGDFIRGSYFLLEFCNKYGLKPEITINHPIALSLKGGQGQIPKKIPFIPFFPETNTLHVHIDNHNYITGYDTEKNNINHFIRYLYQCEKMQTTTSTPTTSTPTTSPTQTLNTYNIMLPYEHEKISEENLLIDT
jgi:hypothetical protein